MEAEDNAMTHARRPALAALALALALALLAGLPACAAPSAGPTSAVSPTLTPDAQSSATRSRFRVGEVTDYQGKNLDPAIGPSDNSIGGVQRIDIGPYRLLVDGDVADPQSFTYEQVRALDPVELLLTLHCVTGWDATILWKGVRLADLIDRAKPGDRAVTVIFTGVDTYTTSLPLSVVREKDLILAYGANGLDLPPELGYPFIVVAEDKLGYKWARWVTKITLSDDPNYMGYWESRGYDNDADVTKTP